MFFKQFLFITLFLITSISCMKKKIKINSQIHSNSPIKSFIFIYLNENFDHKKDFEAKGCKYFRIKNLECFESHESLLPSLSIRKEKVMNLIKNFKVDGALLIENNKSLKNSQEQHNLKVSLMTSDFQKKSISKNSHEENYLDSVYKILLEKGFLKLKN